MICVGDSLVSTNFACFRNVFLLFIKKKLGSVVNSQGSLLNIICDFINLGHTAFI